MLFRSRFFSRKALRVTRWNVLPLGLLVLPSAVLINLLAYAGPAALGTKAFALTVGLLILGASLFVLMLPEMLCMTDRKASGLIKLVGLLMTFASLVLAIAVQLTQRLDLQTLILLALLAAAIGMAYTFRKWTNWIAK